MGQFIDAILEGVKEGSKSAIVKIVVRVWVFLNLIVVCALVKHVLPDAVPSALGLAALFGAVFGGIEVEIVGRALGRPGLVFDFTLRATKFMVVGLAIAFAFALGLTVFELNERVKSEATQRRVQTDELQSQQQIQAVQKQFPGGFQDMQKAVLDAKAKVDAAKNAKTDAQPQSP